VAVGEHTVMHPFMVFALLMLAANAAYAAVMVLLLKVVWPRGSCIAILGVFLGIFLAGMVIAAVIGGSGVRTAWADTLAGVVPGAIFMAWFALATRASSRTVAWRERRLDRSTLAQALGISGLLVLLGVFAMVRSPGDVITIIFGPVTAVAGIALGLSVLSAAKHGGVR
jgi:hypothetical protein